MPCQGGPISLIGSWAFDILFKLSRAIQERTMDENLRAESTQETADSESEARRAFIQKMGRAGAAAPAVALLLAANYKSANAQTTYGGGGMGCGCGCGGVGGGVGGG